MLCYAMLCYAMHAQGEACAASAWKRDALHTMYDRLAQWTAPLRHYCVAAVHQTGWAAPLAGVPSPSGADAIVAAMSDDVLVERRPEPTSRVLREQLASSAFLI